jgi:hypothetical protein
VTDQLHIVALDPVDLIAFDNAGSSIQIVTLWDRHGEETRDWDSATAATAGPTDEGQWWAIDLTAFRYGALQ